MEFKDVVYGRRFVRNFKETPIDDSILEEIIDAAMWALQDEGIVQSIAASMENLVLSAYDHGVSSCWMTATSQANMTKEIRDEFAPGHGELVAVVALGYRESEEPPKAPKRKQGKFVFI